MKKIVFIILAIMLVMSTLLAGCSQSNTPTTPSAPASSTPTSPASTGPKRGGTLIIQYGAEVNQPGDPRDDSSMASIYRACAVETLARLDNTDKLNPYLAESWNADPAAKTFTVKLKKGIMFQDGTELKADAVKFTWGLYQEAKRIEIQNVTSVDIIDDYTVRANLIKWDNSATIKLLWSCGHIISPASWEKNGEEAKNIPVGTGPFKYVSWTPNVGAEFVKWDGYWQKDKDYPYLDGVEFKAIADTTTAEAALRAGEVDLMEIITDGLTAKNLSTASGIVVTVDKSGIESATWQLQPDYGADGETTIWDDINIRKAVAYALDFEPIINSTQYGYAMASNQWCMPNNWAYSPNVKGYPYDPEKAKECLAAAGYPNGFDTTLMCFSGMENVAQAIQGMLAEVGIKASIQAMAPPAMYEYIIKGGYKGLRLAPYRCNGCVPYRMSIYFTTGAFEGAGIFHSPELDQMFEDCLTAPDFETEKALAWKINEYLYDTNCAAIPMYLNFGISAKQSYVKDDSFATCGDTFWTPEKVWLNK